jgi:hypothetical protein
MDMVVDPSGIFATNNTNPGGIDVTGTTLQGNIKCTYDDLVHAFGEPIEGDTTFSWLVMFNDYSVARVYGPKTTVGYVYWDIDGFDKTAFTLMSTAVQRSLKEAV